ncbi:MAG: pyridoxal-phosphate dependent enzyme [Desulfobacterales bacterium]|nr:pyridoxal-phosphate dependent enzyme [Desulfobacterales bacterium]
MKSKHLHIETPLIESLPLAQAIEGRVWLKMEALQPTGSFKLRGIGYACKKNVEQGATEFVSSSGGNAGIAVAYSGRKLGIPVTVVVPESTSKNAIKAIDQQKAKVIIQGKNWNDSHKYALDISKTGSAYIHPFDDPILWKGHSTIIDEVVQQGLIPDITVLSVGGGGLLCGVIEGLVKNNLSNVPVVAVETKGADSLSASLKCGYLMELDDITSIATSLGAKKVAKNAYEWCHNHEVISHVVSDREALDACFQFSQDHRILVEPACGASLAAVYEPINRLKKEKNILVIVCGGGGVSISQLEEWNNKLSNK